jgi:hypothetical protein
VDGSIIEKDIKLGLSMFLNYLCIPFPSIIPDNREYTVVPAIILKFSKEPSIEKCLGPTTP